MNNEIKQLINQYENILNSSDTSKLSEVYTADAIFIGQPFPTAVGLKQIERVYEDFLSKLDFNVTFKILEITLESEIGYIQTKSFGSITPKGHASLESEGNREIFIVKKVNNIWKLHRYIFNTDMPA